MRFQTALPGLHRYPPELYPRDANNWVERLTSEDFRKIAQTAEELGYDAIASSEHIVMPVDLAPSMGNYWTDALTVMTFVAGATRRIRVNSSVIVLPYHEPVAYAKAVSTLDVLSGGRVTVTFGVGMARASSRRCVFPSRSEAELLTSTSRCSRCCGPRPIRSSTASSLTSRMFTSSRSRCRSPILRSGSEVARWPLFDEQRE